KELQLKFRSKKISGKYKINSLEDALARIERLTAEKRYAREIFLAQEVRLLDKIERLEGEKDLAVEKTVLMLKYLMAFREILESERSDFAKDHKKVKKLIDEYYKKRGIDWTQKQK
ncbi:MAG: hypothetical protein LBC07_04250, partial [Elusimicrobiota bacterium]|nr:hypothetical protein [Elusimicrobiota bacterium]